MLMTVVFRYLGTLLQFAVLAVIARSVSGEDYGRYMLCLSITFSCYYVVGLGASEAAVNRIPRDLALGQEDGIGRTVGSVLFVTLFCAAMLWLAAISVALFHPGTSLEKTAIIFVLLFLSSNGIIFNTSQILLGLGQTVTGSFLFYPAINLTLLFSTVPTALLLKDTEFTHLALASSLGSGAAAVGALIACLRGARRYGLSWSLTEVRGLIAEGYSLTGVRILHVSSFWIPTMVAGFLLSPTSAGLIGTAGRLAIAVSAVIAASRFVIRPAIARSLARGDQDYLRRMAGSVAFISTAVGLSALIANELAGEYVIGAVFGKELQPAAHILTILLLSVCAEAVFGPVDEILKVSRRQKIVAWIYGIGVPVFLVGCLILTPYGLVWIAWLQVAYVLGIFLAMNLAVKREFGFVILPRWPDFKILRNFR